jgi:SAM-dependent methyltransferase
MSTMTHVRQIIRADFDRLASLPSDSWDHNSHYHAFLLRHVPARCGDALDLGCGTGIFTRQLAHYATRVYALDLSPVMIQLARERSSQQPNIVFHTADIATWSFPDARFDCIVSIATLHHLPLAPILIQLKAALKPNGALLILDLYEEEGLSDQLMRIPAIAINVAWRLWKNGRIGDPYEVRAAWLAHGQHDTYLPVCTIRQICAEILPTAQVRKHLLWRYSIVWRKEAVCM